MPKKKNKLTTSAKPLDVDALREMTADEAAATNGGLVFGLIINPHPKHPHAPRPPKHPKHPIFGLIINPHP